MNSLWGINDPKIKALDCTIRDGGLVNDHRFSLEFVRAVYQACVATGVDYMELGYRIPTKSSRATPTELGNSAKKTTFTPSSANRPPRRPNWRV